MNDKNTREWQHLDCPISAAKTFTHLFEKAGEPFVQCNGCGLIMINPRPIFEQVLDTYDEDYSKKYAKKIDTKRKRAKRFAARIRRFVTSGRWLDVGCSAGFIVEAAQNAGFDAHGVDVEQWGINYAQQELKLQNVKQGFLDQQAYPNAFFDVITVYEVIEHVPDLNAFLAELSRILKPGGVLEIRTPDVGHWRTPKPLKDWEAVLPSEHLYYFSRPTLQQLLLKHQLKVLKWGFNFKPGLRAYVSHQ
ncbi:MAG: class I SAM-dependent methyltransferase [Methylophilaceae bacterium]